MAIFLFLKQIVDMFFEKTWLDVIMAMLLVLLFVYQCYMLRPDSSIEGNDIQKKKKSVCLPDVCLLLISIIIIAHILLDGVFSIYQNAKIFSAVLMYVLGRMAYQRVEECTGYLALSSYIVIYTNLIMCIVTLGFSGLFDASLKYDGMYYYGTDMAYAMLTGLIFVSMYAKNTILKFVTIFLVCPIMVMRSLAGVQQILLIPIYIILFLFMAERAIKRRRYTDYILPIIIALLLVIIVGLNMPAITGDKDSFLVSILNTLHVSTENFVGRFTSWNDIWDRISASGIVGKLFGISVEGSRGIGSEYLGIVYSTGFTGLILFIVYILSIAGYAVRIYDRKTYYVTVMLAVLFLGTSINVHTMMFTQLSWFPMLYAGMAVSAGRIKKDGK